ncbi:acyl carrier protein [Streptomyces lasalocidi]
MSYTPIPTGSTPNSPSPSSAWTPCSPSSSSRPSTGTSAYGSLGAVLYEHPTPALLARHLTALRRGAGEAPAASDPGASAEVLQVLREQLARMLHCDPWEIDGGAAFAQLGIDSILAADFIAGVNQVYGLSESPVTVHEQPSLAAMASYIASRTRGAVTPRRRTPAVAYRPQRERSRSHAAVAAPRRAAAPRPPLTQDEMVALLDAVRDNRIGVDEAAALLADRSA